MTSQKVSALKSYAKLHQFSHAFSQPEQHLKHLLEDKNRLENFSIRVPGFFYDYSRQRVNQNLMQQLFSLAQESKAKQKFSQMTSGEKINSTESRAALHTATRDFTRAAIFLDGQDVMPQIKQVNHQIKAFTQDLHENKISGHTGKPFSDAVVIGIGGSYLGCQFVYEALKTKIDPKINLHFLSNVDIDNFGEIIKKINPQTCLWVVISKTYTTAETLANLNQALLYLKQHHLDPACHLITITAKGSPGESSSQKHLASFNMFDYIGGRYSVSSAVGALPLSLAFGFDVFEQFLKGCHAMDIHAQQAPDNENIPLTAALIGIWNTHFLGYPAQAIIPYCSALSKLAPHVQQLYMESLGKSVTSIGEPVDYKTGCVIFGEPGTNAQHSFFQLAHQGMAFPVEFIGIIHPVFNQEQTQSKGVYNHQELWANMLAQAQALAIGKDSQDSAKYFSGNRPSSTIIVNEISPETIGMLLAFYEARTVYEGFILGINPFDQFGVELGKVLASGIRKHMAQKNKNVPSEPDSLDPITHVYLDMLFKGSL
ncbi:MAG: glucose-6-phosphate isomerase [Proteobacteria bacterium]|nr:glucose-6-phosphate isomerase [Pseudomonadota bacterium]MBU1389210.1 glucose-6-phosphate isomerase [Pseudomonadota bacterium]MBU1543434.1 glucose-6-phosphate isomerase [Pseudomonadota bacterium]MBU2430298.1 glucose-6-phosphate isomerase [Pseudomonadota bacterium]MBU2482194.1 glucose-6-phosphate isomerase [Pseudomonadota bacterium]